MQSIPLHYLIALVFGTCFLASCSSPETTTPSRKQLEEAVFASGYIEQEESFTISAKVEGILTELSVQEGDWVRRGTRIARLEDQVQNNQLADAQVVYRDAAENVAPDAPPLQQLETQLAQARKQLQFDRENVERYERLWAKKSVARVDFEKVKLQYETAQANLRALEKQYQELQRTLELNVQRSAVQLNTQESLLKDYTLVTNLAGTVTNLYKKQGELVRRGEAVAKIGSGTHLIKLQVAESDIVKVRVGKSVAVRMNTYPQQVFGATVTKIYPAFDESEQSYLVEARFTERPERLFSGTQLQANIEVGSRTEVLVVPTDFILKGQYVLLEGGLEKQIEVGNKTKDWTEVISGISEADILLKPTN